MTKRSKIVIDVTFQFPESVKKKDSRLKKKKTDWMAGKKNVETFVDVNEN